MQSLWMTQQCGNCVRTAEPPLRWRLLQRRLKPGQPSTIWCWMGTRPRRWQFTLAALVQTLPLIDRHWSTTLLWNRSPASNFSGAPLTSSSRGKIMLTASTPRPTGGCTFCAYSEGPGLNHTTLSESSPLQFSSFWYMHVRPGTPASLENSQKWLNPFTAGLCTLLSQTCHTGQAPANFGFPSWRSGERGWLKTFSLKLLETLIINCATSSHMRERSSKVFEQPSLRKTRSSIQPELGRPLFPMRLLPTGYEP